MMMAERDGAMSVRRGKDRPERAAHGGNGAGDGFPSQRPRPVMEEPQMEEMNEKNRAPRRLTTPAPGRGVLQDSEQ